MSCPNAEAQSCATTQRVTIAAPMPPRRTSLLRVRRPFAKAVGYVMGGALQGTEAVSGECIAGAACCGGATERALLICPAMCSSPWLTTATLGGLLLGSR